MVHFTYASSKKRKGKLTYFAHKQIIFSHSRWGLAWTIRKLGLYATYPTALFRPTKYLQQWHNQTDSIRFSLGRHMNFWTNKTIWQRRRTENTLLLFSFYWSWLIISCTNKYLYQTINWISQNLYMWKLNVYSCLHTSILEFYVGHRLI